MPLIESPSRLVEQQAYRLVLKNLGQPDCMPWELRLVRSGQVFHYGEHGYGLVLPKNFLYISTENGEGLSQYRLRKPVERLVRNDSWLDHAVDVHNGYEYGQIPESSIDDLVAFAVQTRTLCQQLRGSKVV